MRLYFMIIICRQLIPLFKELCPVKLYSQLLSALCSPGCKNLASASCLHSCPEAVHFASLSFFRLICHFCHCKFPPYD